MTGEFNVLADQLSISHKAIPTEWSLCPRVFHAIARELGDPGIDLFATALDHQTQVYISLCPDPNALALDALGVDWSSLPLAYGFPPMPILPKVLQKIRQSSVDIILVAPAWPTQSWFLDLLNLSMAAPIEIPVVPDLLSQTVQCKTWTHRNTVMYNYHTWMLSGIPSKRDTFSQATADRIAVPQQSSTRSIYDGKWAEFCSWCSRKKTDPVKTTIPIVADFFVHLFERRPPLAVSTIRGYRSAISSTIPSGSAITNSKEIGISSSHWRMTAQ